MNRYRILRTGMKLSNYSKKVVIFGRIVAMDGRARKPYFRNLLLAILYHLGRKI